MSSFPAQRPLPSPFTYAEYVMKRTYGAYHLSRLVAYGQNLTTVVEMARDYLMGEGGKTHPSSFVVTVWCEDPLVMIGVFSDDANGLHLHKLPDWDRFAPQG